MEIEFEFENNERGNTPLKVHILSGSYAGIMEHVALFPFDTIKVKIIIF